MIDSIDKIYLITKDISRAIYLFAKDECRSAFSPGGIIRFHWGRHAARELGGNLPLSGEDFSWIVFLSRVQVAE